VEFASRVFRNDLLGFFFCFHPVPPLPYFCFKRFTESWVSLAFCVFRFPPPPLRPSQVSGFFSLLPSPGYFLSEMSTYLSVKGRTQLLFSSLSPCSPLISLPLPFPVPPCSFSPLVNGGFYEPFLFLFSFLFSALFQLPFLFSLCARPNSVIGKWIEGSGWATIFFFVIFLLFLRTPLLII